MRRSLAASLTILLTLAIAAAPQAVPDPDLFFRAASRDAGEARRALSDLSPAWKNGYAAMLLDLARLMPVPRASAPVDATPFSAGDPDEDVSPPSSGSGPPDIDARGAPRARLIQFLERQTGQRFGQDLRRWRRWIWSLPYEPHPRYLEFKGAAYAAVDPRFAEFFAPGARVSIRLDEIDWGGVGVNGIPPLDHPKTLAASDATYLDDDHIVFGVFAAGEARAYPKRILAWHEMALDRVGGLELTVVYCTLCGTVIPYQSEARGRRYTFGTSGLLYRSNKLMFDHETKSLWNTLTGRPVLGPLVGSGVELQSLPVVSTTWKEWRAAHPDTRVLSLDTGFKRDYREGAAYREYFRTDRLMFEVPETDARLKNKAEVFGLLVTGVRGERVPVALSAAFLAKHPVHHLDVAGVPVVIITSLAGANRAYRAGEHRFTRRVGPDLVEDDRGRPWRITEDALVCAPAPEFRLDRLQGQRAFWFGWRAQHPDTQLVDRP